MPEVISCLLCLNSCRDYKCLYDADGVYDMELYNITVKYFNTMFLTETTKDQLPVVCFKCWQYMSEFSNFQSLIIVTHEKLSENRLKLSKLADGNRSANRNESPTEFGLMSGRLFKMGITTEPICNSSIEKTADNYIEPSIHTEEERSENLSSDVKSQGDNLNDVDSDLEEFEEITQPVALLSGEESVSLPQQSPLRKSEQHTSPDKFADLQNKFIDRNTTKREKIYKSPQELDEIISKWKSNFECSICQTVVSNFPLLRSHTKRKHPHMKCQISCCQRLHLGASVIAQHALFHMDPQRFKCHLCSKSFKSTVNLSCHRRRVHSNITPVSKTGTKVSQFTCRVCEKMFVIKNDLEEHEAYHLGVRLYNCLICSKSYMYRSHIYRHFRKKHPKEWENRKKSTNPGYTKVKLDDVATIPNLRNTC